MGVQAGARLEQRPGFKEFNEKEEEDRTTQAKKAKETSKRKESSCKNQMVRKKTKMGKSIKAKV